MIGGFRESGTRVAEGNAGVFGAVAIPKRGGRPKQ
jgi:hypothetical protein